EAIYIKLSNPINKCYLLFLEFVLPYLVDLNVEFQSECPKVHVLYQRMSLLYRTILEFYMKVNYVKTTNIDVIEYRNPRYFLNLNEMYLGPKLAVEFATHGKYTETEKEEFRKRCLDFYIECISQINKRFLFQSNFVKSLKLLEFMDPKKIESIASLGPIAISFPIFVNDMNDLDKEWRLLKASQIHNNTSKDVIEFWNEVREQRKGDDSETFPHLNKLIRYIFTLPHSSASVERIFSQINLNKTKIRNQLSAESLTGILHTKRYISSQGKHCFDY
ncbi:unnamed protein product, partial [Tenebrio molitor]